MKTVASLLAMGVILAAGGGCVPALRQAPALQDGSDPASPSEAEAGYREAVRLYASREEDPVRRAGELLRAGAGALQDPLPALLVLAELRVWQVEHEPDPELREDLATRAVHAGQWCMEVAPDSPACRYRLAIAVGVQARERPGTGLDAMPIMLELLQAAGSEDPGLDHGGPDRVMALLYLRAPGWPSGPGDADLGYQHAVAAAEIDPVHPPNRLVLGEALEALDRESEAIAAYVEARRLAGEQQESGGRDAREWLEESEAALNRLGS